MSSRSGPQQQQEQTFSTSRPNTFTKVDLKPRRYHAWNVVLFIFGTLFPPLAVAARFGIGSDFWLNLLLTICGYIPGHAHNFYIQNIRNNKNHRRTPKWAIRYGLVDDSEIRRKERRSQWAGRYNDRLPRSVLDNQEYEEGQVPDRPPASRETPSNGNGDGRLWDERQDEHFYGQRNRGSGSVGSGSGSGGGSGGRWRYPANFEEADVEGAAMEYENDKSRKKGGILGGKKKKDRWALSEDARRGAHVPDGEYVGDYTGGGKKKKKKEPKVKRRKKGGDGVGNDDDPYVSGYRNRSDSAAGSSTNEPEEPEDAVGGLYGDRQAPARSTAQPMESERQAQADQELFGHQF